MGALRHVGAPACFYLFEMRVPWCTTRDIAMIGCKVEWLHLNIGFGVERVHEDRHRVPRRRRCKDDASVPRLVLGPMPGTYAPKWLILRTKFSILRVTRDELSARTGQPPRHRYAADDRSV